MVPAWLMGIARLTPIFVIVSLGLIAFGVYRMRGYMAKQKEERDEEEIQRQKLLRSLEPKIKNIVIPKADPNNTK